MSRIGSTMRLLLREGLINTPSISSPNNVDPTAGFTITASMFSPELGRVPYSSTSWEIVNFSGVTLWSSLSSSNSVSVPFSIITSGQTQHARIQYLSNDGLASQWSSNFTITSYTSTVDTPYFTSPGSSSTFYLSSGLASLTLTGSSYSASYAGSYVSTSWQLLDSSNATLWTGSNNSYDIIVTLTSSYPALFHANVKYYGQYATSSWGTLSYINMEYKEPYLPSESTTVYKVDTLDTVEFPTSPWSSWMNTYAVWIEPTSLPGNLAGDYVSVQKPLVITTSGTYTFNFLCDNDMQIEVDSSIILPFGTGIYFGSTLPNTVTINLTSGTHQLNITGYNAPDYFTIGSVVYPTTLWSQNPAGFCCVVEDSSSSIIFNLATLLGTSMYCPDGTYSTLDSMCHCYSPPF